VSASSDFLLHFFPDSRIQLFGIFIDFSVIYCQPPASLAVVYTQDSWPISISFIELLNCCAFKHIFDLLSLFFTHAYSRTCLRWSLSAALARNLCRLLMFSTVIASRSISFMRIASVPCLHCCVMRAVLMIRSFSVQPFLVFSPRNHSASLSWPDYHGDQNRAQLQRWSGFVPESYFFASPENNIEPKL